MTQSTENVKKPWYRKWWVLAIFAVIILNAVWSNGSKESSSTQSSEQDTIENVIGSDNSSTNSDLTSETKSSDISSDVTKTEQAIKTETPPVGVKQVSKSINHTGLYTFNNLAYGNFLILEKNGIIKVGLFDQKGYCNSRCEGSYVINGNVLVISDLYNANWDGASEMNGEWSIEGKSIKQLSSSSGYWWFKKGKYQDLGTKILL